MTTAELLALTQDATYAALEAPPVPRPGRPVHVGRRACDTCEGHGENPVDCGGVIEHVRCHECIGGCVPCVYCGGYPGAYLAVDRDTATTDFICEGCTGKGCYR